MLKKVRFVRNFPLDSLKIGSFGLPMEKFSWDFLSLAKAVTGQSFRSGTVKSNAEFPGGPLTFADFM
jgi:hypothetical protein